MDGPVVRVTGNGDASLNSSIGRIADREFERLWDDERTLYITVVDGEPQYTELATREGGDLGRRRILSAIKSDPERVRVAVLELHERLRSNDAPEAVKIANVLDEIGELHSAETVLREAVNSGYVQFVEYLVRLQIKTGNQGDAERTLRRAVSTGSYFAIFRLIKLLDSTGRSAEVEGILREGTQAGNRDALRNLVDLLDRLGKSHEADRILEQKGAEGIRMADHLLAIRDFNNGYRQSSLDKLREWAQEDDHTAQDILRKLELATT
jgi:hypothetical protein